MASHVRSVFIPIQRGRLADKIWGIRKREFAAEKHESEWRGDLFLPHHTRYWLQKRTRLARQGDRKLSGLYMTTTNGKNNSNHRATSRAASNAKQNSFRRSFKRSFKAKQTQLQTQIKNGIIQKTCTLYIYSFTSSSVITRTATSENTNRQSRWTDSH